MSGPDTPKVIQVMRDQQESYNAALAKENTNEIKLQRMQEQLDKLMESKKAEDRKKRQLKIATDIARKLKDDVIAIDSQLEHKKNLIKTYLEDIKYATEIDGAVLLGKMRAEREEIRKLVNVRTKINDQSQRNWNNQLAKQEVAKKEIREWEEAGSRADDRSRADDIKAIRKQLKQKEILIDQYCDDIKNSESEQDQDNLLKKMRTEEENIRKLMQELKLKKAEAERENIQYMEAGSRDLDD